MKTKMKNGISLIVLVITIIVLAILAATVVLTITNSGLINIAKDTVSNAKLKQVEQIASLAWAEAYADGKRTQPELDAYVKEMLAKNNIDTTGILIIVTTSGVTVQRSELNEWGFYYGECYMGVSDGIKGGYVFHEDGSMQLYTEDESTNNIVFLALELPAETATYSYKQIAADMGGGFVVEFTVSPDGLTVTASMEGSELALTCTPGTTHGVYRNQTYKSSDGTMSAVIDNNNVATLVDSTGTYTYDVEISADDHLITLASGAASAPVSVDGKHIYFGGAIYSLGDTSSGSGETTTNPYESEEWVAAWACNNGTWGGQIAPGNTVSGDVVVKIYPIEDKTATPSSTNVWCSAVIERFGAR